MIQCFVCSVGTKMSTENWAKFAIFILGFISDTNWKMKESTLCFRVGEVSWEFVCKYDGFFDQSLFFVQRGIIKKKLEAYFKNSPRMANLAIFQQKFGFYYRQQTNWSKQTILNYSLPIPSQVVVILHRSQTWSRSPWCCRQRPYF